MDIQPTADDLARDPRADLAWVGWNHPDPLAKVAAAALRRLIAAEAEIARLREENADCRASVERAAESLGKSNAQLRSMIALQEESLADKAEIARLKRGDFTEREFQDLCHHFGPDDAARFKQGCEDYQRKLFGCPKEKP